MKVLVSYDDTLYLVNTDTSQNTYDIDELFNTVNSNHWPDECQDRKSIMQYTRIIAFFSDESQLIVQK